MTIEILPARLANQIAAGEVVERPASVIKELMENSLDAGADKITIVVEKGGIKSLRISDNGAGIVKEELMLALSRHATSKIKNLTDLESIASLGFRGEALASISSVSRLTLTSKPKEQATAWQACAQGRDMDVSIQPAAHPDGTSIEVNDLFFNTPARRKFLRTEKTEFSHIDEVVRRIALARFDVSFTLQHNGKMIRQYRAVQDKASYAKRVAMVCGKQFIEQALEVDCQHGDLHLWGWLAKPSFYRSQNDLCYSYVNGRMMRDKLINHAIRQAYADRLIDDSYPAFVLFLQLDHQEVDVNVHPAKHEVRFHQGRYVHDFIFSVCQQALDSVIAEGKNLDLATVESDSGDNNLVNTVAVKENTVSERSHYQQVPSQDTGYIKPLTGLSEPRSTNNYSSVKQPVKEASDVYQALMTPYQPSTNSEAAVREHSLVESYDFYQFIAPGYFVLMCNNELRLVSLFKLAQALHFMQLSQRWQSGLVSQPLLLPISIPLTTKQCVFVEQHLENFQQAGIFLLIKNNKSVQIRQFPALLRAQDVSTSFTDILERLLALAEGETLNEQHWCQILSQAMVVKEYSPEQGAELFKCAKKGFLEKFEAQLLLNSVVIDLTSPISQLI